MGSILNSIKQLLGIEEDYKYFDTDIIMHINATFMTLHQLGVGPEEGFSISGEFDEWESFLGDSKNLEAVKTYIYLKVRTLFDPPSSSAVLTSYENQIKEYEWRLNVQADK